ncbi:MAG: hypothetical protein HY739_13030 [Desulfobacterales bacterium]|nr:hypothetical protein [Desulfobacterales bacterium]
MTQKEYNWLKRLESEIDQHWDELTKWEKGFMEDIIERFNVYGEKTIISKGQWDIITRVSEKLV